MLLAVVVLCSCLCCGSYDCYGGAGLLYREEGSPAQAAQPVMACC